MPDERAAHGADLTGTEERRIAQRVEILGTLHADVLIAQPLIITDISDVGLQVVSDFPLHLHSLHECRLTLDGTTVVVKGRIVHASVADLDGETVRYRSGIALEEAPEPVRVVIEEYARKLRALRA